MSVTKHAVGCLVSSTTRLYLWRVTGLTSDNFTCCHTRDRAGRPWPLSQSVTLYGHRPNHRTQCIFTSARDCHSPSWRSAAVLPVCSGAPQASHWAGCSWPEVWTVPHKNKDSNVEPWSIQILSLSSHWTSPFRLPDEKDSSLHTWIIHHSSLHHLPI